MSAEPPIWSDSIPIAPPYGPPPQGPPTQGPPTQGPPMAAPGYVAAGGPPPHRPPAPPRPTTRSIVVAVVAAMVMTAATMAGGFVLYQRIDAQSSTSATGTTTPGIIERHSVPPDVAVTPSTVPPGAPITVDGDAVAAKVDPSVVDIDTELGYQSARAAGTGMILTSTGRILTNNHVVNGATKIQVTVVTTGATYEATVVGTVPTEDVAVLQLVGAKDLTPITVGDASKVAVGDPVVAIGNAGGTGGLPTVVTGAVTATNQTITAGDESGTLSERLHGLLRVDAPIEAGDSGGPLSDASGAIIGMNTAASVTPQFESTGSVGYAIPIQQALAQVDEIVAGRATATVHLGLPGILGVQVVARGGAFVAGVAQDSAAAKAGIEAGSTITAANGVSVTTPGSLSDALAGLKPGAKVKVSWTDPSGAQRSATVTLGTGPAD